MVWEVWHLFVNKGLVHLGQYISREKDVVQWGKLFTNVCKVLGNPLYGLLRFTVLI